LGWGGRQRKAKRGGSGRHYRRALIIAALLTGVYLAAIATNSWPWLRGPQEWRWPYVIPRTFERAWLPAALLLAYVVFLHRRQPRDGTSSSTSSLRPAAPLLLVAGLMTPALQLALLYVDHPDFGIHQLFYRTVSELSGGFFNVGAPVTDVRAFLAEFVGRMPGYPVHPQRHPPGLPLLFALARGFFDGHPEPARAIAVYLQPAQCHNLELMNLPPSAIAAATLQMAVPLMLGIIVWPLYVFGRLVYGEAAGRRAALLWPLVPSIALWATRWNQLYGLFTLPALILVHRALMGRRPFAYFLGGLVVGLSSLFSLGNVVIALFAGLYALFLWSTRRSESSFGGLVAGGLLFAAGSAVPWLMMGLFGVNFFAVWSTAMGTHLSLGRSYVLWLFYHPYDMFVFLGIAPAVFWAVHTWRALRDRRPPRDVLALSFFAGLLILIISGTSQGETARVWAFLMPVALLIAIPRQEADGRAPAGSARHLVTGIALLLAAQVFVSNLFLRPVSTGLTDPPGAPPEAVATAELARWEDGPLLIAADFPAAVSRDDPLVVELVWGAWDQSTYPYTVFVHLMDAGGNLVAQDDRLPLDGEWLTTCWLPGMAFTDAQVIPIPDDLPPGEYTLLAGLYWLPDLVRQPLVGAGDVVELGRVRVLE